eukprot:EC725590.1.p2 GENE.EC725590.1~~EC725590.1.p2  ORF type:complete len:77 (-),score=12.52 EC725590.1:368-598(-)
MQHSSLSASLPTMDLMVVRDILRAEGAADAAGIEAAGVAEVAATLERLNCSWTLMMLDKESSSMQDLYKVPLDLSV